MTKKLFAIVLAAMLVVTMFTFPASAAGSVTVNNLADDNTISFSWGVASGATKYQIQIKNGTTVLSTQTVNVTSETNSEAKCKSTYKATNGGNITIAITAVDAMNNPVEVYNTTVDVPVRQSGTNGVSVSGSGTTTTVSWNAVQGVTNYYVEWVNSNGGKTGQFITGTSYPIPSAIANIKSITIYRADSNNTYSTSVGTWNYSGNNSGNNNYQASGISVSTVSNGYASIYWNRETSDSYYTVRYTDANGNWLTLGNSSGNSASVKLNPYTVTGIYVYAYVNNGTNQRLVGYATIPAYANGSSNAYQNLTVSKNSSSTIVSWNAVSNTGYYHIKYTSPYNGTTYDEYVNIPYKEFNFGPNTTWTVAVYAITNSTETFIGGANITPNGVNQSYNYNTSNNNTNGYNCSVSRYANEAYLVWNATSTGYLNNTYRIIYTIEGEQAKELYSGTPAVTIPVGSGYTFSVYVYDVYTGQIIANGRFTGTGNTNNGNALDIKKSEIKNVKVTNVNSYTTKVSWDKTSDAAYYLVQYGTLDGSIADEDVCYNNYYDRVPFGSSRGYFVNVYYWSNSNKRYYEVGHVYNVPGTSSDTSNTVKNYPSEFKATSGTSKKVTLSWTAADGASYYNVYYKRSTSTKWLKINKDITKTAVNVNGLTDGVNYQFKVVTNKGVESGVLTIAPSTTSTTVRAKDPASASTSSDDDGDVSVEDNAPSLRSATSSAKGSITVSWNSVGAASYRIYVAESNSNTYKYCGAYTGTQATITAFGSGSSAKTFQSGKSYKVRVVRSDYKNYGSISNALSSCSPLTVTVK